MSSFDPAGSIALVTGANRGIGKAFVEVLLARGASKVYAGARSTDTFDDLRALDPGRVTPVQLDVTDDAMVAAAAAQAGDVNLLVNNAGTAQFTPALVEDDLAAARADMEVNYFGTLRVTRAFAGILGRNGGGGVINIISVAGVQSFANLATYSASKAALHSITQAVRFSLGDQGTSVVGVYPGPVATDMTASMEMEKDSPTFIAEAGLDALTAGTEDVYPGEMASGFRAGLQADPKKLENDVAHMVRQMMAGGAD